MTREYNAAEYMDALVTLELCAITARLDGRQISNTMRACWKTIRPRITNDTNRKIFDGVSRQPFPVGALSMLRRQLDEMVTA